MGRLFGCSRDSLLGSYEVGEQREGKESIGVEHEEHESFLGAFGVIGVSIAMDLEYQEPGSFCVNLQHLDIRLYRRFLPIYLPDDISN